LDPEFRARIRYRRPLPRHQAVERATSSLNTHGNVRSRERVPGRIVGRVGWIEGGSVTVSSGPAGSLPSKTQGGNVAARNALARGQDWGSLPSIKDSLKQTSVLLAAQRSGARKQRRKGPPAMNNLSVLHGPSIGRDAVPTAGSGRQHRRCGAGGGGLRGLVPRAARGCPLSFAPAYRLCR
jgi:hypothetical protein